MWKHYTDIFKKIYNSKETFLNLKSIINLGNYVII